MVAVRTAAGVQFLLNDAQGTAMLSVNVSTQELTQRRYTPFGQPRGPAVTGWPGERGFVGGTLDASTGLTHLGAREYDPDTGRFISVDPLIDPDDPQQMNGYGYANNTPITASDPDGRMVDGYSGGGYPKNHASPHPLHPNTTDPTWYPRSGSGSAGGGGSSHAAAAAASNQAKKMIKTAAVKLVKIAAEVVGITDAFNCFTKGDIAGCASTALTIASAFVGGFLVKLALKSVIKFHWAMRIAKAAKDAFGLLARGVQRLWAAAKLAKDEARRLVGVGRVVAANRQVGRSLGDVAPEPNATVRDLVELKPGNPARSKKAVGASSRSDEELMNSVFKPGKRQYMATHHSVPGTLLQGNHRRFELLARAEGPESTITWETPIFINRR